MLEKELLWERKLFFFLNGSDSVFWDNVMYIYSYMLTWIPFYLCFIFVFCYKKNWKDILLILLSVVLLVLLCDQLSSGWAKPFFHRFRPTHHPDFKDLVDSAFGYRGGKYGFFSGHAANSFGFATFMSLIFRNKAFSVMIFIFAIITAYSRVYLGVHFISDIIIGTIAGLLIGALVYEIFIFVWQFLHNVNKSKKRKAIYSKKEASFLIYSYIIILTIILIFNNQIIKYIT